MNAMIQSALPESAVQSPIQDADLLAQHDKYYNTVLADSAELVASAHALRFQVYCLEREFEKAEEHPDGLETDAYDSHSVHGVVFHRPTKSAIGTARMILPKASGEESFPVAALLRGSSLDLSDYVDLTKCIEVSRFAISKEFRRRKADQMDAAVLTRAQAGREINLAFLSLLQFVLHESVKRDVLYWTAVMEPKFLRLLARMGICYTAVGPLVMHHGIRQPCYCYLPDMLENARLMNRQSWEVLTDGGLLHHKLLRKIAES
jgi:N-acyl amino acid synthase of PEP-CTERM/exosortase system